MVSRASTQSQRAKVDGGMLVSAGQLELDYVLVVLKKALITFKARLCISCFLKSSFSGVNRTTVYVKMRRNECRRMG